MGRTIVAGLTSFVVVGVAVHLALLYGAPYWATDHQISAALKRGARKNVLQHGKVPRAGTTSVPLANPDMLASRAFLDLGKGPMVIEGERPVSCSYWSTSVFAHNTDTVLVKSDRDLPNRHISIGLRLANQSLGEPVDAEAVLPSKTGVVLIRCFMRDRTNADYVAKLTQEIHGLSLRPAKNARA